MYTAPHRLWTLSKHALADPCYLFFFWQNSVRVATYLPCALAQRVPRGWARDARGASPQVVQYLCPDFARNGGAGRPVRNGRDVATGYWPSGLVASRRARKGPVRRKRHVSKTTPLLTSHEGNLGDAEGLTIREVLTQH